MQFKLEFLNTGLSHSGESRNKYMDHRERGINLLLSGSGWGERGMVHPFGQARKYGGGGGTS